MMNSLIKRAILMIAILWVGLIFAFSAQTASESWKFSGEVIEYAARAVTPGFNELSEEEQKEIVINYQYIVRKTAHFLLYLGMGALSTAVLYQFRMKNKTRLILAGSLCTVYAAADEIHQIFVKGREGRTLDIIIDSCGAIIGILLVVLIYRLWNRYKAKKDRQPAA